MKMLFFTLSSTIPDIWMCTLDIKAFGKISISLLFTCLDSLFSSSMYFCSLGIKVRMLAFTCMLKRMSVFQARSLLINNTCFNLQKIRESESRGGQAQRQEGREPLAWAAAAATKREGCARQQRRSVLWNASRFRENEGWQKFSTNREQKLSWNWTL